MCLFQPINQLKKTTNKSLHKKYFWLVIAVFCTNLPPFVAANWANWGLNKFIAGVERNFGASVHLSCGLDFVEICLAFFLIFLKNIINNIYIGASKLRP